MRARMSGAVMRRDDAGLLVMTGLHALPAALAGGTAGKSAGRAAKSRKTAADKG